MSTVSANQRVDQRDEKKFRRFRKKLLFISNKSSRRQRQEALEQANSALPRQESSSAPKTKVTLNLKGNLRGMHNAGESEHMKKVRAMRRFYNKQMPELHCNICAFASTCSQFKAGYKCAFLPFLNSHRVETEADLIDAMKNLVDANMRRMHLATLMETLRGGAPSPETTEALNLVFFQLQKLHESISKANESSLTLETDDQSIIKQIFGGLDGLLASTREAKANPIEVGPEPLALPDSPSELSLNSEVDHELIREHTKDELLKEESAQDLDSGVQVTKIKL